MIITDHKSITITGPRNLDNLSPKTIYDTIDTTLNMWDASNVMWYVGGALGIDTRTLAYLILNSVGNITVVVPGTVAQQPIHARETIEKSRLLRHKIAIIELRHPDFPKPNAYHNRNRYMVDRSEIVIGFINTTVRSSKNGSGTEQTLKYAADTGKLTIRNPMS